jgi:type II restriction enzyme
MYCVACSSDRLTPSKANFPAVDLICPACAQPFQLKSSAAWNRRKIVDSAYGAMLRAIRSQRVPNLLIMQYSADWLVRNLLLVPSFFFTEAIIEKRPPLGPAARRAGWVGCNILLDRIPPDGKIPVVSDGAAVDESRVRQEFSRTRRLAGLPPSVRGWTLDVLGAIRSLKKTCFSLQELYSVEPYLRSLHPNNRSVRPKIRQQLQLLRDLGLVRFTRPGNYEVLG